MNTSYDVIVVGGGPVGATVSTLLAQRDRRVLVLERDTFPRYHVGESLISGIVPIMRELGVEEELDRLFPWKYGVSLVWGNDLQIWRTNFGESTPYDHSWHVDRKTFDDLLLTNAAAHGVEVIQQAKVTDVVQDSTGRITGVTYRVGDRTEEASARMVVDASGQTRAVSRKFTEVSRSKDLKNVATWRYFENFTPLENPGDILIEAVPVSGGWIWGIPVSEERLSIGYVAPAAEFARKMASGQSRSELFDTAMRETKRAQVMIQGATPVDGERSARDFSHTADHFWGPGWVGIGDAVAFIDPLFSSGVWMGTSGAWIAARAIDAALSDPQVEQRALANYEKTYRAIVQDMLAYVEYFSDPSREREDYLQKAQAATETFSQCSQIGFVSLISGVTQLPAVLNFDPVAAAPISPSAA